jgi:hypothetical protein
MGIFRVGLLLSNEMILDDYNYSIGGQTYEISFYRNLFNSRKFCDLIITDRGPDEINHIPPQQKNCHGTALVINKLSNPCIEQQYEKIFTKASEIKHNPLDEISEDTLKKIINIEFIKYLQKNNKLDSIYLIFNKDTRGEIFNRIFDLSWLVIPFILIIGYLGVKLIGNTVGYSFSFLCWFVEYEPDCNTNILEELKLLALIYSVFNLKSYYDYILSMFDNINNEIYQVSTKRRLFHKCLQFLTPLVFFSSAVIIFKALFVFKYGFRIAAENGFINIDSILDRRLSFLKDDYLIYYFILLDICLWLITKNFFKTLKENKENFQRRINKANEGNIVFSSKRQNNLIKEAQNDFGISIVWEIVILIFTSFLFRYLIQDPQSILAVQLILLQFVYLYINISTIFYDFKYS